MIVVPSGKETGSTTVIDSTRIIEYLEDLAPESNPLFPGDPDDKAEIRFRVDHSNERAVPCFYRCLGADQPVE